jgi:1-acyl-sn-glycerol-3-phosphate acyltransferase
VIRTLWVGLNGLIATAVVGSVVIIASVLRVRGRIYPAAARFWSRWLLAVSGVRLQVEGRERLALDRPQIVISNHESWYDVFAISASMPKTFHFVAKKELERIPLFGRAWKAAGHVSIDRSDRQSAIRSLETAGASMASEDAAVVIFPEGTRSPDGRLLPFKKGAFMLSRTSGVELLPAAVSGSRVVMAKGTWRIRPGTITVRYGRPIAPPSHGGVERVMSEARTAIAALRDAGTAPSAIAAASDPIAARVRARTAGRR